MSRTETTTTSAARTRTAHLSAAPIRPRRNPRLLVLGIIAVCLGALASAGLYAQHGATQQVLRVTRALPRGAIVAATDLGVVSLPATPGVAVVPAARMDTVVGQEALVDLPAGSLVGPESVGQASLPAGTVQIGLKLGPGRAPARAVPVGAAVQLIAVPGKEAAKDADASFHAIVVTAPAVQPDGAQILDVAVAAEDAARIARLSAGDALVLVREAVR